MRSTGRSAAALAEVLQVGKVILAMNGVVPGHMTALRYVFVLGSYALGFALKQPLHLRWALGYFLAATVVHYVYLIGMLRPGGWSRALRNRIGQEPAFLLHESWTAFVFCHNALSTGVLCLATHDLPMLGRSLPAMPPAVRWALAGALVVWGLGAKIWATRVARIDAYYYRDLFLERTTGSAARHGPYRFFDDPMYTIGHLYGYGIAVLMDSTWGLFAVAFNQALILTFNHFFEAPHVRRMAAARGA